MSRRTLRLVHTSDVHIGEYGCEAKRLAGLASAVDAAIAQQADALLIAGDLFDSARVTQPDLENALAQLARLDMPIIVTTGNHDCLEAPSVHERISLRAAGPHLYFLDDPNGSHVSLPELDLTVWARAMVEHHPGFNPLAGYVARDDGHWQVVLAHGHYTPTGLLPDRSSPLLQADIGGLGCDYLALGHWHRFLDVSHNGVAAFYSGSPSEHGGSYPSVNLVTLQEGAPPRVERVATLVEAASVAAAG